MTIDDSNLNQNRPSRSSTLDNKPINDMIQSSEATLNDSKVITQQATKLYNLQN